MLLRRVARPLLAAIFVTGGVNALRDLEGHTRMAEPLLDTATGLAPVDQPPANKDLVRADAVVKIAAGLLLATGKAPRLASAALAASLIPTTLAGHRFWEIDDPAARQEQQIHFMKNAGLLGGLMLAAADTAGKPSLAWRAKHVGKSNGVAVGEHAAAIGSLVGKQVAGASGQVQGKANALAESYGPRAADLAHQVGDRLGEQAEVVWETAEKSTRDARLLAADAARKATDAKTAKKARMAAAKKAEQARRVAAGKAQDSRKALPIG